MSRAAITREGAQLQLSGVLDHASVPVLREQGRTLIAQGSGPLVLDCAGVEHSNSAGLALLLAWLRDAQAAGCSLAIARLPSELRQIAEVSDALELLPLADDAHG
ncbi:phospholipid transport system transporter-binding protein [Pseudomonas sp. SORGH_AS 211]|uniref:STAS domain-containing protein n=1 Tax=Pseudomonas sp. SORGH_AS_0211 TaxID=3041796 RepID=UPI002862DB30|nr:STAS domain-containing protein [Pseudomonas sp. SORGH_AS_0211]MDR6177442.1 phospholipid transport system transporter-binding protein [Pseudomonas sp. SORGH_AS_0211]